VKATRTKGGSVKSIYVICLTAFDAEDTERHTEDTEKFFGGTAPRGSGLDRHREFKRKKEKERRIDALMGVPFSLRFLCLLW
jgi:hypothetical protein